MSDTPKNSGRFNIFRRAGSGPSRRDLLASVAAAAAAKHIPATTEPVPAALPPPPPPPIVNPSLLTDVADICTIGDGPDFYCGINHIFGMHLRSRSSTHAPHFLRDLRASLSRVLKVVDCIYDPAHKTRKDLPPFRLFETIQGLLETRKIIQKNFAGDVTQSTLKHVADLLLPLDKALLKTMQHRRFLPASYDVDSYTLDDSHGYGILDHFEYLFQQFPSLLGARDDALQRARITIVDKLLSSVVEALMPSGYDYSYVPPEIVQECTHRLTEHSDRIAALFARITQDVSEDYNLEHIPRMYTILRNIPVEREVREHLQERVDDYIEAANTLRISQNNRQQNATSRLSFEDYKQQLEARISENDKEEWIARVHRGGTGKGNDIY